MIIHIYGDIVYKDKHSSQGYTGRIFRDHCDEHIKTIIKEISSIENSQIREKDIVVRIFSSFTMDYAQTYNPVGEITVRVLGLVFDPERTVELLNTLAITIRSAVSKPLDAKVVRVIIDPPPAVYL